MFIHYKSTFLYVTKIIITASLKYLSNNSNICEPQGWHLFKVFLLETGSHFPGYLYVNTIGLHPRHSDY